MAKQDENAKVVIKKYANRRLYNTAKSSYVTLEDLSQMVRNGEDFTVFDAKTNEDITRSVLTQIIVEQEGKDQNMLPTNFLRQLIKLYGDPLQGVVPSYLDATMEAFNSNQDKMRDSFSGNAGLANFEQMTRANMDLFQKSMSMFSPFTAGAMDAGAKSATEAAPKAEAKAAPTPEDLGGDLDALQKQLREMQSQLEKLSKGKG